LDRWSSQKKAFEALGATNTVSLLVLIATIAVMGPPERIQTALWLLVIFNVAISFVWWRVDNLAIRDLTQFKRNTKT